MCERSLFRGGYVGSLLNLQSPDSFYFSNLRPNGSQLAALPPISYPRGALPWAATPASCTPAQPATASAFGGFSQPYLTGSGPLGLQSPGTKDGPEEQVKFYTPDASTGSEERSRTRPPFAPESSLAHSALKGTKYDYASVGRAVPGSATLLQGGPCASSFKEDTKGPLNLNMTVQVAGVASCLRSSLPDGKRCPRSPSQFGRGREVGCQGQLYREENRQQWQTSVGREVDLNGLTWVGALFQACRGGRPRGGPARRGNRIQSSRLRSWRTNSWSMNSSIGRSVRNCPTG